MCVRLDRRAVYLGTPGANQRCPAERCSGASGRSWSNRARPRAPRARRCQRRRGGSPPPRPAAASSPASASTPARRPPRARWRPGRASPYRAIGVYIGGSNRGCSQPNLTSSWVSAQTAAGWHLIPTYVGLQAPTSSCSSCAKLSASRATAQGEEAAVDAVAQAAAVAMGPGSPIYFDMESYTRTSSATAATLAFLEAWTEKLHSLGYVSGVYSSSASGIADLAGQLGSGYILPDNLWFANWNGQAEHHRPLRPRQRLEPAPAHPPVPRRPRRDLRRGHDQHRQQLRRRRRRSAPRPRRRPTKTRSARSTWSARPRPGQVRVKGWAFDLNAPTEPLAIRAYVGGRPGAPERRRLRPRRGRQPAPPRRRRQVPAGRREPRLRRHLPDRQVGPAAGLRLRAQHRRRRRPPARLQVDHGPGRGHALGAEDDGDAASRSGSPANGRQGPTAPGSSSSAPGSRSPSRTAAARRRGSAPSPARSGAAPSSSPASGATAS